MLQGGLSGSWLPRGLYSTTPGGLPLGQHKEFLCVRALGVGWGGTRTSCAKQRSIGAPLPLGRVSTRPQAASVARETGSARKLKPKPGVSGLEAGPGESVRAECCGLHAGGREGLRWGPRKAPPESPRGRDWGGRMEGKVRTHLLAWLALYSLGQPHATQGVGKREAGREKRKDKREAHTQESVLTAQRPNERNHCEIRNKTKHRC